MSLVHRAPFYFLRHGLTAANLQDVTCGGDWDIPLHPQGVRQAEALKAQFRLLVPEVERVVSSPMLRARETAETMIEGTDHAIEIEEDLREWRLGTWERAPWAEVKPRMVAHADPPEGETAKEFTRRIVHAVSRVLTRDAATPLVVSHGAVAHVLFKVLELDTTFIDNCQIYWIVPGKTGWRGVPVFRASRPFAA